MEFGPFPGDGGTPPGPSGDLKVTFTGGESILQNLKASSGTFNFSVDRTLRGKTVSIALGSGTITTSATVPVTGALRASYSGVTVGPNTLTITIDGKMWTGSVNFK